MPSIDWNKLNSPNPIVAWDILSQEISDKFFARSLLAVPSIDQASYYDLMVCFSKVSHFWQLTSTFSLLGHFLDISVPARERRIEPELWEFLRNPLKEDLNATSYSHTWTDDINTKSVTIKMSGLSKYELNWNLKQGSLVLDCEKVDLCNDSVYIISEVVYAEKVIIDVQISTKEKFGENTVEIRVRQNHFFLELNFSHRICRSHMSTDYKTVFLLS